MSSPQNLISSIFGFQNNILQNLQQIDTKQIAKKFKKDEIMKYIKEFEDPVHKKYVTRFNKLYKQFLITLAEVFPKCEESAKKLDTVVNSKQPKDYLEWYKQMDKHFIHFVDNESINTLITSNKLLIIFKITPFFKELNFCNKWCDPGFTDHHKEVTIKYIRQLNIYSNIAQNIDKIHESFDIIPDKTYAYICNEMFNYKNLESHVLKIIKYTNDPEIAKIFKTIGKQLGILMRTFRNLDEVNKFIVTYINEKDTDITDENRKFIKEMFQNIYNMKTIMSLLSNDSYMPLLTGLLSGKLNPAALLNNSINNK